MMELGGRTAFVTGGASGIGLALGQAFAEAGMNVVLADIESAALEAAVAGLSDQGLTKVRGVACDVADPASVNAAADAASKAFGPVHVVCNNAGVGGAGGDTISLQDWRWCLDVNLMGVVHGVGTFLPHMREHGQGGHIVNTASMAGMIGGLGFGPYTATKFAVVGISEGLAAQLAPLGVGVTVVCPGFVRTRIADSARNRQDRYGPGSVPTPGGPTAALAGSIADQINAGIDPRDVAGRVVSAVRRNELYVFTHTGPEWRARLEQRFDAIRTAMDKAAADTPRTADAATDATAA